MDEYIEEKLAPAVRRIGAGGFDRAIATSASAAAAVSAINRVTRARRETADRLRASAAQVRRLFGICAPATCPRAARCRHRAAPRRNHRSRCRGIPEGFAGFRAAIALLLIRRGPGRYRSGPGGAGVGGERARLDRDQRRVVERMARRYGIELAHARKVAALAHACSNRSSRCTGCRPSAASSSKPRRTCTTSAISSATWASPAFGLRGSQLRHARLHRPRTVSGGDVVPSSPQVASAARHEGFAALGENEKKVVQLLTPLLRLADSLDRSHEQRVEEIECQIRNGVIVILLRSARDTDLEQWAAERWRRRSWRPTGIVNCGEGEGMKKAPGIRQYSVEQVANLLGRLVFQIHHATRSHNPDAIHDLRVSIRRFNQATRAFAQFFPARDVKKIRRRLHEIMVAAAQVRDRDIALELCAQADVPETAPLRQAIDSQRDSNERELRGLLKRFETRDYSSRWRVRLRL